jgi:hypothetical protein
MDQKTTIVGAASSSVDCLGIKAGLVDGTNADAKATMRNNTAKDSRDMALLVIIWQNMC